MKTEITKLPLGGATPLHALEMFRFIVRMMRLLRLQR